MYRSCTYFLDIATELANFTQKALTRRYQFLSQIFPRFVYRVRRRRRFEVEERDGRANSSFVITNLKNAWYNLCKLSGVNLDVSKQRDWENQDRVLILFKLSTGLSSLLYYSIFKSNYHRKEDFSEKEQKKEGKDMNLQFLFQSHWYKILKKIFNHNWQC